MDHRAKLILVVAAASALLLASSSSASPLKGGCPNRSKGSLKRCVIGHASASGSYATTVAGGHAIRPTKVSILVYTKPAQKITGYWSVVCSRGLGAASKSGHFSGMTVNVSGVPTPTGVHRPWRIANVKFPMKHPDDCTVSADAQLNSSGSLLVQILAIRRG